MIAVCHITMVLWILIFKFRRIDFWSTKRDQYWIYQVRLTSTIPTESLQFLKRIEISAHCHMLSSSTMMVFNFMVFLVFFLKNQSNQLVLLIHHNNGFYPCRW